MKKKDPAPKRKVGRPRKYTDAELFDKKVDQYFIDCDAKVDKSGNGEVYSITGLALYLGYADRFAIIKHEERSRDEKDEFVHSIKKAMQRIEKSRIEWLVRGKGWGPGIMFDLKNNFGWKDIMGLEHAGPGGEPLEMSSLEVAARIATILELARKKREELAIETEETKAIPEKIEASKN